MSKSDSGKLIPALHAVLAGVTLIARCRMNCREAASAG
jgi:hypothetical protein